MIRRFGGSTSPAAQWPEEDTAGGDEEDRFERMEKLIEKAMKRMTSSKKKKTGQVNDSSGDSVRPTMNQAEVLVSTTVKIDVKQAESKERPTWSQNIFFFNYT